MAVRYASIFAKKYGTLVRYAFFVMVQVRYVGTLFELDGSLPANPVNDRRIANAVTLKSTFCQP